LVSPVAWTHYYSAWLLALLCTPLWFSHHRCPAIGKALGAFPAFLIWIHYLLMDFVGPLGLLGLGATVWFFAACGAIAWVEAHARIGTFAGVAGDNSRTAEISRPHIKVRPVRANIEA
jgi:hypothetical protein